MITIICTPESLFKSYFNMHDVLLFIWLCVLSHLMVEVCQDKLVLT